MSEQNNDARLIFASYIHYRRWLSVLIPSVIPDTDVSFQQLNVLYYVRTEDASMADIARMLGVAPTVVTGLVDRLEKNDLIRREAHPTDRRRIQLVLTDKGRTISEQVEEILRERIDEQVKLLDSTQQREMREGLRLFEELMRSLEQQIRRDELTSDTSI